jgi:hypothetical protein
MSINYKRSLKLVFLLLTSLLIASASAAIYYSLNIAGTLTTAVTVCFDQGTDWPTGSSMGTGNTTVTLALKAYPNTTLSYSQALKVKNTGSGSPDIRLRHVSITNTTNSVANFTFLNIVLLDDASTVMGYLNYTRSGTNFILTSSTSYQSMDASDIWSIRIETKAVAAATAGIVANLQIAVDVQE